MIVVYDITRRETFDHVEYWITEVRSNMEPDATILLVGNKSDQQTRRAVSTQEAENYAGNSVHWTILWVRNDHYVWNYFIPQHNAVI